MSDNTELQIETGDEDDEEAYVEYDIATYPSDYTLEGLSEMKKRGDIVVPAYQRRYVWSIKQASLLVESFYSAYPCHLSFCMSRKRIRMK